MGALKFYIMKKAFSYRKCEVYFHYDLMAAYE